MKGYGRARRRPRLRAGMSPNGRLVHLVVPGGRPVCGSRTLSPYRVQSQITCSRCTAARPAQAARHAKKRRAIGLDWNPYYDAVAALLDVPPTKFKMAERLAERLERMTLGPIYEKSVIYARGDEVVALRDLPTPLPPGGQATIAAGTIGRVATPGGQRIAVRWDIDGRWDCDGDASLVLRTLVRVQDVKPYVEEAGAR